MTCHGRTPHESLPLKRKKFRQFFRVVTSRVSLWYRDHSTANPLGVVPDPAITRTVAGNKLSGRGLKIVTDTVTSGEQQMAREMEKFKVKNETQCEWHVGFPGSCDNCVERYEARTGKKSRKHKK